MNETNRIFIRPKTGLLIRVPETDCPLPEGGQMVDKNSFWVRRLRDGDVYLDKPIMKQADPNHPEANQAEANQAEANQAEANQAGTSKNKGTGAK